MPAKWSDAEEAKLRSHELLAAIVQNCDINYKEKSDILAGCLGGEYTGNAVYQHLNKIKRDAAASLSAGGTNVTSKGPATPKKRARKPKGIVAGGGSGDDEDDKPATPSKKVKNRGGSGKLEKSKAKSVEESSGDDYANSFLKSDKLRNILVPHFESPASTFTETTYSRSDPAAMIHVKPRNAESIKPTANSTTAAQEATRVVTLVPPEMAHMWNAAADQKLLRGFYNIGQSCTDEAMEVLAELMGEDYTPELVRQRVNKLNVYSVLELLDCGINVDHTFSRKHTEGEDGKHDFPAWRLMKGSVDDEDLFEDPSRADSENKQNKANKRTEAEWWKLLTGEGDGNLPTAMEPKTAGTIEKEKADKMVALEPQFNVGDIFNDPVSPQRPGESVKDHLDRVFPTNGSPPSFDANMFDNGGAADAPNHVPGDNRPRSSPFGSPYRRTYGGGL
ncbi:hypothetical protein K490DRAFT_59608 [Saccharata proteae CBS 121410]|uniref:Uncharacterized protein n=1 Tax=Saccharata proteae CBS 121410 TaxID=1314787 RepID=A0A9P4LWY8_9PEZI|nr:hypothetical protein K490DRAFT_59608 [Saccharata proteae CBS 121410]